MNNDCTHVSVVIPTHNRRDLLVKCIEGFRAQSLPVDRFELVVVDDGSDDGTRESLAEAAKGMPNLRHFSQESGGPARARNLGLREAKGPLILFTGDDCIPAPRLLEEHIRSHEREGTVAVLGHIDWHPDLEVTPFMEYVGRSHQFSFPIIRDERLSVSFGYFYTSNISVSRELLLSAGLFDEEFREAVWEDAEMGYRLSRAGVRIVYNRRARTYHCHPVTLAQYIDRQIRAGKAAVVFYRKHPEVSGMLRVEDAVSPEIRENFYDAVLRYYYAVGVQAGLAKFRGGDLDTAGFKVPLDETLQIWEGRISARLLRRLRHETGHVMRMWGERDRLAGELRVERERAGSLAARVESLEMRGKALERDLDLHRAFADKVKRSLPYRIYKSLKALRGGEAE